MSSSPWHLFFPPTGKVRFWVPAWVQQSGASIQPLLYQAGVGGARVVWRGLAMQDRVAAPLPVVVVVGVFFNFFEHTAAPAKQLSLPVPGKSA